MTAGKVMVASAVVTLISAFVISSVSLRSRGPVTLTALAQCQNNLRKMGSSLRMYMQDNNGNLPCSPSLAGPQSVLAGAMSPKYLSEPRLFYCPSLPAEQGYSDQRFQAGRIGYFYYSAMEAGNDDRLSKFLHDGVAWPRALSSSSDPSAWVLSDIWVSGEPTAHAGYRKGVNYLMLDGSVGFVAESPRQSFH